MRQLNREAYATAIPLLEEAIALDPEFAAAWAELGGAYGVQASRTWAPLDAGLARARAAVTRALELDPASPNTYVRLAVIQKTYDWNWRAAEASYAKALELAPGSRGVLTGMANMCLTLGRVDEAVVLARQAAERDPLSPACHHNLGNAYHFVRRPADAEASFRAALALSPGRAGTYGNLALMLSAMGRHEEALAEAQREPDEAYRLANVPIVLDAMGRHAEADALLAEFIAKFGDVGAYQVALVLGARGDVDGAFDWLGRAYQQRDGGLAEFLSQPLLDSLRNDPRWEAFVRKMGLMT
jgi:tetratricopeptide (TPR) repeat protein